MRLIGHNQNVMVGVDWLHIRLVEFLNQREDKAGIAPQLLLQICPAGRDELAGLCLAQQPAVFKGITNLGVQLVPVGQDDNGGRTGELTANLLRQEHHGVTLSAALRMPEHTQLAVVQLAGLIGFDRLIDAEILVVPGKDFCCMPTRVVKQDEVFQQIQKVFLFADAAQHGFQRHTALFLLGQTLPLVEKLIFAAQGTHLGLHAVGEDEKGVVVEQVRNGILIVGVIVGIGILHVHCVLFQLYEQQRDAVDKAHDIRAAAIQIAVDLQLLDGEEVVVVRILKINDSGALFFRFAAGLFDGDRDTVAEQEILFLVDLQQGGGGQTMLQFALGLIDLCGGDPRIQAQQSLPKIPGQQNLFITFAPKGAVLAQLLRVVGKSYIPAQLILEQVAGGFLNEDIFRIVVAHVVVSNLSYSVSNASTAS